MPTTRVCRPANRARSRAQHVGQRPDQPVGGLLLADGRQARRRRGGWRCPQVPDASITARAVQVVHAGRRRRCGPGTGGPPGPRCGSCPPRPGRPRRPGCRCGCARPAPGWRRAEPGSARPAPRRWAAASRLGRRPARSAAAGGRRRRRRRTPTARTAGRGPTTRTAAPTCVAGLQHERLQPALEQVRGGRQADRPGADHHDRQVVLVRVRAHVLPTSSFDGTTPNVDAR